VLIVDIPIPGLSYFVLGTVAQQSPDQPLEFLCTYWPRRRCVSVNIGEGNLDEEECLYSLREIRLLVLILKFYKKRREWLHLFGGETRELSNSRFVAELEDLQSPDQVKFRRSR
jgi:hypothetical protein